MGYSEERYLAALGIAGCLRDLRYDWTAIMSKPREGEGGDEMWVGASAGNGGGGVGGGGGGGGGRSGGSTSTSTSTSNSSSSSSSSNGNDSSDSNGEVEAWVGSRCGFAVADVAFNVLLLQATKVGGRGLVCSALLCSALVFSCSIRL